jgi:hypothetical protein
MEDIMKCSKCGGLMVYENFYTLEIANLYEWRCVPCGEIIDHVILENRSMQGFSTGIKGPRNLARKGKSLIRNKRSKLPHYYHA